MRKSDPRIAGRAFDDRPARAQLPPFFGILNDVQRGAVFDAATGILKFGFAEDLAAGFVGKAFQPDEGRVTDGWGGRGAVSMSGCLKSGNGWEG